MQASSDVNYEELARSTDDFNAAQLKAVCVEAGMLALRREGTEVSCCWFHGLVGAVRASRGITVTPTQKHTCTNAHMLFEQADRTL